MQLMSQKNAFACFCGDEKLNELEEKAKSKGKVFSYDGFCQTLSDETVLNCNAPFTVRIKKPEESIKFNDAFQGEFEYKPYEVDYFHILTHEKSPTYNYACAIDDMLSNVSTVIRSENYLQDTAKQIHVRSILNYNKEIKYIHLPIIENAKDYSIKSLIDEGFLPSAIANYLVLLGNETPNEVFTLEDAVKWFDISNLSKEKVKFDIERLREINKKHLETMDNLRLSKILGFADADIGRLGKLFLEESCTIKEIKSKIDLIFAPKTSLLGFEKQFDEIKACLKDAPYFDDFNNLKLYITNKTSLEDENLLNPLSYILIGQKKGPEISKVYALIKNYLGEIVK